MRNKSSMLCYYSRRLIYAILMLLYLPVSFAEMATLFTTPQERQIINANRYKSNAIPRQKEGPKKVIIENSLRKEVKKIFEISGITVSSDGIHSAWVNNKMYEDGERIEGGSKIKVIVGSELKVRITPPDGKHYYGTSGERVEVTYLEAADI